MDTNILVKDLIEEGKKIVAQLSHNGFEVTSAFWLRKAENGEWYFYIMSPLAEDGRLRGGYGRLHALIRQIPEFLWINPLEVTLIEPSSSLAKDVLAIYSSDQGPKDRPIRWSGYQLGNVRADAAFLYPLPAPAAH